MIYQNGGIDYVQMYVVASLLALDDKDYNGNMESKQVKTEHRPILLLNAFPNKAKFYDSLTFIGYLLGVEARNCSLSICEFISFMIESKSFLFNTVIAHSLWAL